MGERTAALPQWTWEDLENALDRLGAAGRNHPVREHLMRGLRSDAGYVPAEELLRTLLCTAVLVSQLRGSATARPQEDRSFGSC